MKQAAYCAAKGGVINLTRQLGAEWAGRDIRVNAIAPGWFPSEITEEMFENEKSLAWIRRNTPMRVSGPLDELDGALLLLATSTSSPGRYSPSTVVGAPMTVRLTAATASPLSRWTVPRSANAMTDEMWALFESHLRALDPGGADRVLVVTGAGGAFCGGRRHRAA